MITHRMIPARNLKPSLATIVVSLPGKTIRSRAVMVQTHGGDIVQVAFASGDILSMTGRTMVGRIEHQSSRRSRGPSKRTLTIA